MKYNIDKRQEFQNSFCYKKNLVISNKIEKKFI